MDLRGDPQYPLRHKYVENIQRFGGGEEAVDNNVGYLSAETELIARSSYLLGHAEEAASNFRREAELHRSENIQLKESLESTKAKLVYVREERDQALKDRRNIAEMAIKKDKQIARLKPKKASTKSTSKGKK